MRRKRWRTMGIAASVVVIVLYGLVEGVKCVNLSPSPAMVSGYFTQWSIYEGQSLSQLVSSGSAARLTHLNYAFAKVNEDGRCQSSDPWADYQWPVPAEKSVDGVPDAPDQPLRGNFNQLRKLKNRFPRLQIQISIGGWTFSQHFSDAAATEDARVALVASCIDLFLRGNPTRDDRKSGAGFASGIFDGFDVDWEWPCWAGRPGNAFRPEDRANFTLLLKEFREQMNVESARSRRPYSLGAFLPANPHQVSKCYEQTEIFRYLEYATIQGYDFHGPWECIEGEPQSCRTNHQSAIFAPTSENAANDVTADAALHAWILGGAPARKLLLGVPFYGLGWTGVPDIKNGLFQYAVGRAPASSTPGYEKFRTLKGLVNHGYRVYRDDRGGFAWLFDGTTFWTMDDPRVICLKGQYARGRGIAGLTAWSLDGDTASGELVKAMSQSMQDDRLRKRDCGPSIGG